MGACCGGGRRRGVRPFGEDGLDAGLHYGKHIRIGDGYWDWGYLGGKRPEKP